MNAKKNKTEKDKRSFLLKSFSKIKYLLLTPMYGALLHEKKKDIKPDVFSSQEFKPSCSFSSWLIDSYMKDLIEEPLLSNLSNDALEFTLMDYGMGVWHWDVRTDVVFYSSETLKIVELESDDRFDGWQRWHKIVHPNDLEGYLAFVQKCFDPETIAFEHCYRVKTSKGQYKWIIDKAKVVSKDSQGRPLYVVGTHIDVLFQRRKDQESDANLKRYRDQNKQLLNLMQIISHDLTAQTSNIKLLLDVNDLLKNTDVSETLITLRAISNGLNDTISHLREVAAVKGREVPIKPLQVGLFLKKVLSAIRTQLEEKKATIINNIAEADIVNFNPAYLESILLNLSTNAIKYAYPKRPLVLKFDFFEENNKKVLTVADNGLGIDLEKYGLQLFDIYKTFHGSQSGSGLGLHMVKNQVESMKAKLEVASSINVGTIFKITFND